MSDTVLGAGRYRAEQKMRRSEKEKEIWIQQNEVSAIIEKWTKYCGRIEEGEVDKLWGIGKGLIEVLFQLGLIKSTLLGVYCTQ